MQPGFKRRCPGLIDQIGFGDDQTIGQRRLLHRLRQRIDLLQPIHCIHQRHHAIQPILGLQHGVGHQCLHHRGGVSQAGGFDHQPVEIDDLAIAPLDKQVTHGLLQITAQHAAQATVVEQHHLFGGHFDQIVIDGLLA